MYTATYNDKITPLDIAAAIGLPSTMVTIERSANIVTVIVDAVISLGQQATVDSLFVDQNFVKE